MIKILTGIRPTAENLHIGHFLLLKEVADKAVYLANKRKPILVFLFIADYHAVIQFSDERKKEVLENVQYYSDRIRKQAKNFLKNYIKKYHSEAGKYITIYSTLQSALKSKILPLRQLIENFVSYSEIHSLGSVKEAREKYGKSKNVNVYVPQSFYNYPILQIADVMAHNPDYVIVGKDQQANLKLYGNIYNKLKTFVPEKYFETLNLSCPFTKEKITLKNLNNPEFIYVETLIPGTDGRKMSKSYGNVIDIFEGKKEFAQNYLKYQTDGHKLDEPGNYQNCLAFKVFENLCVDKNNIQEIKEYCTQIGSKCKECKEKQADYLYTQYLTLLQEGEVE